MSKNNLVLAFLVVAVVVLAVMVIDLRRTDPPSRDSFSMFDFQRSQDQLRQDRNIQAAVDSLRMELDTQRQREEYSRSLSEGWR